MKPLFSVILFVFLLRGYSQSSQSEYLESKRQFALENFAAAKLGFQNLLEDDVFGAFASFYYALSLYHEDEVEKAYDMWRQAQANFPKWDQQVEVSYWLAITSFELGRYAATFGYLNELPKDLRKGVLQETFEKMPYDELLKAYQSNPDSRNLASYLARFILSLPYSEIDRELLSELSGKFDIELVTEEDALPEIKKERYAVAIVLPFMFESFENPQSVIRNSIIWDVYLGMRKAQEDLQKEGIELSLFPFDTKKRGDVTQRLVASGKLENADVIIGPLYNRPNMIVSNYSANHQLTMINPLSSNGEIIGNNPYAYLFKPSYQTQGRMAAKYASENFINNKLAFVFYETDRDSVLANAYLKEIERNGFLVIRFERLTNESAQQVQKDFIEKYEIRLDTAYSEEEIDSIGLLPGRSVKTRPIRNRNTGKILKNQEGEEVLEYYEERFKVKEDSIGHILVASSSNLLANNFISLSEVRNDTIGIIGYKDWLEFSTVSYNQLERLGIAFISPDLHNRSTPFYEELRNSFIASIGREPGEYHLIGYELIYQLGYLLKEHGRYFQRGLRGGKVMPGKVMYGLRYETFHDNQIVPITKLEELRLVLQHNKKE
ncbi:MAG: hypothetical protein AAGC64_11390 [Bacteroidota bacterium]